MRTRKEIQYQLPGGFTPMFDVIKDDPNLEEADKKIYSHIIRRAQLTGFCHEGNTKIAKFLGYSTDYVKKRLGHIKEKGYIDSLGKGTNRRIKPLQLYGGTEKGVVSDVEMPSYLRRAL